MQISVDLSGEQVERLQRLAESLGVEPHELARAAFNDLLSTPAEDFRGAAAHVLDKNKNLYDRLS